MAGRPRKPGKRTKAGRLARNYDKGTERAQERSQRFGTDGYDAIGRAYRSGLLGHQGKTLLDMARSIYRAYWPMLETGRITCTLADRTGGVTSIDDGRKRRTETWLLAQTRRVDALGPIVRRAFDQLVIDPMPDEGPDWLDRIIAKQGRAGDMERLGLAIWGLEVLCGIENNSQGGAFCNSRMGVRKATATEITQAKTETFCEKCFPSGKPS